MRASPHAPPPLVALLLLLASAALYGQQRDLLISPNDRDYRMLPEAMFQMADSGGTSIAVVWGTTELAGGKVRVADYVQAMRNGAMLGPALRVGATNGMLGSHIRITPFNGNFLILYYDDAPDSLHGCWTQLLRLHPYRLEAPHRLQATLNDDGTDKRRRISLVGNINGAYRLLWYDYGSRPGLYSCMVSADGVPDTTEISSSYWSELLSYDALPGLVLLCNPEGKSRIIHSENGAFDPRPMPLLNRPFHLDRDTSLALLVDSTITLYPSLFDSTAIISRTLPLSIWGASPQQALISRDNSGVLLYLVVGTPGDPSWGTRPTCTGMRVRLGPDLAPLITDVIFTDTVDMPGSERWSVLGYTRSVGCNNRWQLGVVFGRNGSPLDTHYVTLDESGIHPASPGGMPRCGDRPVIPVSRVPADSASIIEVGMPSPILLSLPVARTTPIHHIYPAVTARASGIFCSWRELDTIPRDVQSRWTQEADTVSDRNVYTPPSVATYESEPYMIPQPLVSFSEANNDDVIPLSGTAALEYNYNYTADVDGYYGKGRVRGSRFALARPGEKGWRTVATLRRLNQWITVPYNLDVLTGKVVGYDPGARSILVGLTVDPSGYSHFNPSFPIMELRGYDENDTTYWSVSPPANLNYFSRLIPMGRLCYLKIDSTRAVYFRSTRAVDTFAIPTAGKINGRFFKMLGPTFAMTSWSRTDSSRFSIEIFDTAGNRLHAASMPGPTPTYDHMLVQSPDDSVIAILFGGGNGLHVTLLNADLGVIAADTLLSQTTARVSAPNGAFRNDTLFMVWEDHREAQSRIYGSRARVRYTPASGVEEKAVDDHLGGMRLYPNPTGGVLTVSARLRDERAATLELISPLGEIVLTRTLFAGAAGERSTTIDIAELPAGVYIARLRHGGEIWVEKVIRR